MLVPEQTDNYVVYELDLGHTIYIGYTSDLTQRVAEHKQDKHIYKVTILAGFADKELAKEAEGFYIDISWASNSNKNRGKQCTVNITTTVEPTIVQPRVSKTAKPIVQASIDKVTSNDTMDKIKEAIRLLNMVLEEQAASKGEVADTELQYMTIKEFKAFVGTKEHAMKLAKKCKVGHSVFVEMVTTPSKVRLMRDTTRDKIRIKLNIVIKD